MSELPELPPRPRRAHLPVDGLERAMSEGRRRRHRAVTAVAAGVAVVALAVPAVGLLPDRGSDRLRVADDAGRTATPAPPPTTAPAREPGAYREDTDEAAAGSGDCRPGAAGGDVVCAYTGGTSDGAVLSRGDAAVLVLGFCLPRDAGSDRTVSFPAGQEKDVVVRDAAGEVVFRFSETVRFVEGAHDRVLRRGRCVEWSGQWDLATTDGAPVPGGTYEVALEVRGRSADPALPARTAVTVTVP